MKLYMRVIFVLFFYSSCAQQPFDEQINGSRLEIIRHTIEFLATDTGTFRHVQATTCEGCNTYPAIEKYIRDNGLTGASALVNEWQKFPIDENPVKGRQELERFSKAVINKITSGPEKSRRMDLPAFSSYEKKLYAIVEQLDVYEPTADNRIIATQNKLKNQDTNDAGIPAAGTSKTSKPGVLTGSWPGYAMAGILAVLAFLFYRKLDNIRKRHASLKKTYTELKSRHGENETSSRTLASKVKQLEDELHEARRQNSVLQEKLKKEKDRNRQPLPVATPPAARVQEVKAQPAPPPPKPAKIIRYARYADLEDGFSASGLLEKDDSETIFEITISSPASATFKVAENESAQRYALTNVTYYLSNTCWYDTFPKLNDRIHTDKPGELSLEGNKWKITTTAKISFI